MMHIKKFFLPSVYWLVIFLYIFLLMIGPRVPDDKQKDFCVRNFSINIYLGHSMNCDSADWILNTSNPKRLYEKDSIRQPRPGLIFTTYWISKFINYFVNDTNYPKSSFMKKEDGSNLKIHEEFNPKIIFTSYFLVNLMILGLSIYFFFKLFGFSVFSTLTYHKWYLWLSLLIIFNNTVNQFLYSPSTKLLNIFCASTTIYFSSLLLQSRIFAKELILVFLVLGILMLFYASFIVSFVILIALYFFNSFKKEEYSVLLSKVILFSSLFCLPYLAWYFYIYNLNNYFHVSNFTEYRFIIWIFPFFKDNGFFGTIIKLVSDFFDFYKIFFKEHLFIFLFTPLIFFHRRFNRNFNDNIYKSAIFFCFLFSSFFVMLGGHRPINIVSILIIPFAIMLTNFLRNNIQNCLNTKVASSYFFIVLTLYSIWSLIKFGPYS